MRKDFSDLTRKSDRVQPVIQTTEEDRQIFIKRNLVKSLDRSEQVRAAVLEWLLSFNGGITTKAYKAQMVRLDQDDTKALQQLELSSKRRTLANPPRVKPPKLTTDIITALEQHNSIAIEASSGRKLIEKFMDSCPEVGTYILDMNELVLEYVDYSHRGKAGDIIHQSNRADILIILGLEKPISLAYHIRDTLFQILSVRSKDADKYTISTWNYTHGWYMPDVKDSLEHYSV